MYQELKRTLSGVLLPGLLLAMMSSCGSSGSNNHSNRGLSSSAVKSVQDQDAISESSQSSGSVIEKPESESTELLIEDSESDLSLRDELSKIIDGIDPLTSEDLQSGNFPVCEGSDPLSQNPVHCPTKESVENGGMAFVCSSQKYKLVNSPDKFVVMNPNADALWPGSLIQTSPLMSGVLNPVPVSERSPGSVTMTLAADSQGRFSQKLMKPSLSEVTESIRQILSDSVAIDTPAKFYYNMHRIYSGEQLSVSMGVNLDTSFNFGLQSEFKFNSNDQKNRILIDFTQEYYTMAYSPEDGYKGFFTDKVEPADLRNYISEGNPLGYISSVTYGRKIWLMFESDAKITDLEAALKASFQGYGVSVGVDLETRYKKVLNESHIKAWVLGGNSEEALKALNQQDENGVSFVDLQNLLVKGANFSKGNPGLPVSYTVRHVKDSSQIKLVLNTEYTAKECNPIADVKNPATWGLKVTLKKVLIEKENGFCEILSENGEFRTCLNLMSGPDQETTPVFCTGEIRNARPGDVLEYGLANHSATVNVIQRPGESFSVFGTVEEVDGNNSDVVVDFNSKYELNNLYEWTNWTKDVQVTGSFEGCKATLSWEMEWLRQSLSAN